MKHSAPQTGKFKKFVRRIRSLISCELISIETIAIGILERVWHATLVSAPQGDIGKLDNETIAELIGWNGDPDQIINVLVEVGWLDECLNHRLVVHDWREHAPGYLKGNFERHSREFVKPNLSPNPTKPNPTEPNRT